MADVLTPGKRTWAVDRSSLGDASEKQLKTAGTEHIVAMTSKLDFISEYFFLNRKGGYGPPLNRERGVRMGVASV